jgi:hypothetical protein
MDFSATSITGPVTFATEAKGQKFFLMKHFWTPELARIKEFASTT